MKNPFNPAPGAVPDIIVGRDPELSAIREALRRAEICEPPTPAMFIGQRGIGKTVLLSDLRNRAGDRALTVQLETSLGSTLTDRLREKFERIQATAESLPDRAAKILKSAARSLPKITYELPDHIGSVAVSNADGETNDDVDRSSLVAMLRALHDAATAAKRYLLITIDEMQDADLPSMQAMAIFVHESAQGKHPVLFAAAGLSDTRELLEKMRTYVSRWNTFDLTFLTHAQTIEAIRNPISSEGVTIDEAALYALAEECAGYPFFIQVYGSAAWEAKAGKRITIADVEASLPVVRARFEMTLYLRPLARLSAREMAFVLELAMMGPGSHPIGDIARTLGAHTRDISSVRGALARKALIASPIPGRVEFRTPFTDRYVRAHRSELESETVVAYRDELARKGKNSA